MSDKVAEAREWLETPSAMPHYEDVERELIIAVQHIRDLLDEIDRLQERTYLALRQDTDRQIIADSEQYNRGYNDAIDAAVRKIEAEKVVEYDSSDHEYNEAVEACRSKIITLQQKR